MAKSYYEKLKDPRWQKKRLEILERDWFECTNCGDENSTLHVHHGYYERNLDPWDYDSDTLWTLCAECHTEIAGMMADLHKELAKTPPHELSGAMNPILDFVGSLYDV